MEKNRRKKDSINAPPRVIIRPIRFPEKNLAVQKSLLQTKLPWSHTLARQRAFCKHTMPRSTNAKCTEQQQCPIIHPGAKTHAVFCVQGVHRIIIIPWRSMPYGVYATPGSTHERRNNHAAKKRDWYGHERCYTLPFSSVHNVRSGTLPPSPTIQLHKEIRRLNAAAAAATDDAALAGSQV